MTDLEAEAQKVVDTMAGDHYESTFIDLGKIPKTFKPFALGFAALVNKLWDKVVTLESRIRDLEREMRHKGKR